MIITLDTSKPKEFLTNLERAEVFAEVIRTYNRALYQAEEIAKKHPELFTVAKVNTGKPHRYLNLTPEERERRRTQILAVVEQQRQRRVQTK